MPTYTIQFGPDEQRKLVADSIEFDGKVATFFSKARLVGLFWLKPGMWIMADDAGSTVPMSPTVVVDI